MYWVNFKKTFEELQKNPMKKILFAIKLIKGKYTTNQIIATSLGNPFSDFAKVASATSP